MKVIVRSKSIRIGQLNYFVILHTTTVDFKSNIQIWLKCEHFRGWKVSGQSIHQFSFVPVYPQFSHMGSREAHLFQTQSPSHSQANLRDIISPASPRSVLCCSSWYGRPETLCLRSAQVASGSLSWEPALPGWDQDELSGTGRDLPACFWLSTLMSTAARSLLLVVVTLAFWAHVGSHHHSVLWCLVSGGSGDPDWSGDVLTYKPPDYL